MKIYTFFEPVEDSHDKQTQEGLLKSWKDNWIAHGWEPVVINNDHAKSHHMYDEMVEKMRNFHVLFTGNKIKLYGIYCYTRWLAYSALESEEQIFTCDYDLVNNGLKPGAIKLKEGINLYSDFCPCFVSGKSKDFERFSRFMISISELRFNRLKGNIRNLSGTRSDIYHDQDVLVNNLSNKNSRYGIELCSDLNFNLSTKYVGQMAAKQTFDSYMFKKPIPQTLHFSRSSMLRFRKDAGLNEKYKDIDNDTLRLKIVQEKFGS